MQILLYALSKVKVQVVHCMLLILTGSKCLSRMLKLHATDCTQTLVVRDRLQLSIPIKVCVFSHVACCKHGVVARCHVCTPEHAASMF